jgi:hypothetical protein
LDATQDVLGILLGKTLTMNFLCNLHSTYRTGDQGHPGEKEETEEEENICIGK